MGARIKLVILNSNRDSIIDMLRKAPSGAEIEFRYGSPQTMKQRAKLHSMIRDISEQALWCGVKFPEKIWKNIFTAEVNRELMCPDLHGGGYVLVGESTKDFLAEEASGMIDLMHAFGNEHGVVFKGDYLSNKK